MVLDPYVLFISSEPMIDPRGHNHQITPLQPYPHPIVLLSSDIEVSASGENIPDLLILVQVFMEEVLYFLFVVGEGGWADFNLVPVLVVAVCGDFIYGVEVVGKLVVDYS